MDARTTVLFSVIKKMQLALVFIVIIPGLSAQPAFNDDSAGPGEWGFRPHDGSTSERNPPGFSWRPQEGAHNYVFQVARDVAFTDIVHEAKDIEYTVYCPSLTLPALEKLYWRVAFAGDNGQSAWSKVRMFKIGRDAVNFPLPEFEELISRVPDKHPRLFVRPEHMPRLRELAKGELKDRFESLVTDCERIMADPPTTEEPEKYPEGMVRGSDEWRSIWWGNRTYTTTVLNSAATLAFTRLLGGKEEYGQKARELLMAAAEWDPKGATGYRYNDEAGMPYNYYFSRTYTFVNDLLTQEEREKCRQVMKVRGDEMYDHLYPRHLWRPYASHSNRAWHFLGEIGIAFLDEVENADKWVWFATNVFFNVYPVWADDDGGWHEGSSYWASYLNRFTWWVDIQRAALDINAFKMPFFSNAGDFALYVMPPNVPRGGFGDLAGGRTASANRTLMTIFATQSQNSYWMDYVERIGGSSLSEGYIGFIRGALPGVESRSISELPPSKLFRGTGLAMLHNDLTDSRKDVQVLFKSSPFGTQSHGYEAQNSFLLYAYGEPLLIRTGRRDSYGSDHHRNWMWSTRSVNSVTVGGQGQLPRSPAAKGEIIAFENSGVFDYVAGEAGGAYPEGLVDKFTRHILFAKPDLIIIFDDLITPQPQTFEWWLHSPGKMKINNQHDIEVKTGDVFCSVNMLSPRGLVLTQTDQFDPPPRKRIQLSQWHMTAKMNDPSNVMRFVTVLHPYKKGERSLVNADYEMTDNGCAVSAEIKGDRIIALWRTGKGVVSGKGITTDGDFAVIRVDENGKVIDKMTYNGKKVNFQEPR